MKNTTTTQQTEDASQAGNSARSFLQSGNNSTKSNAIEVPSINLPKGGGAIRGIDEKFSVNAVNGTASIAVPLPFSAARGVTPGLMLSYNSGAGNSIFGLGWTLGLSSVKRKTDKGLPQYLDNPDSDTFLFAEAEDLVPAFKKLPGGTFAQDADGHYANDEWDSASGDYTIRLYKPRIEGLFARIEKWTAKNGKDTKWKITTRDNTTTLFGWTEMARIANPADRAKIFEWLPEFVFDDKGNSAHYVYASENNTGFDNLLPENRNRINNGQLTYTNSYLQKILYGNKTPWNNSDAGFPAAEDYLFSTLFDYGTTKGTDNPDKINEWDFRKDAFSDYRAGFEIRTTRLCKRVLLFHHFRGENEYEGLVRSLNFQYDKDTAEDFTFLTSVTSKGYIKNAEAGYSGKAYPPMEFSYQPHDWNREVKTISQADLVHAPAGFNGNQYTLVDLYNEGLPGILTEQGSGWYFKHNLGGGHFEQATVVSPKPSFTGLGTTLQLSDLGADGGRQLVSYQKETPGYFEMDEEKSWQGFRPFTSFPNINFNDANARMLDLNGDGMADVLLLEDNVFTSYSSAGREGFAQGPRRFAVFDEEKGPKLVFNEPLQTIFLADMSGDGLTDLVRIRNGEVCYWPNLGYGNFGTKISMGNAPLFDFPNAFNPAMIRLADIDGSGTTDIIYLGKNQCSCWKNLCGNGFGKNPFIIDLFPAIDSAANITVADLLGNGVMCIVWSQGFAPAVTSPLQYIDLMNSRKPHILVSCKNNFGKETRLEYKASTTFYIADKLSGRPWITRLPFPVHCIAKKITEDKISGYRFASSYQYHHGYYDHAEREFRGFGMVEQTDSESFEHWSKSGAANIVEKILQQEPVVTKTWFHTGAFVQHTRMLQQFKNEYWYSEMEKQGFAVIHNETVPADEVLTAAGSDPALLHTLPVNEWREAARACKGMALRSETFARDALKSGNTVEAIQKELTPFSVMASNSVVELVQPKGQNKHAVFIVRQGQSITWQYERNAADPRITHQLVIKTDEYGNPLESATVAYPRRIAAAILPETTQQAQRATITSYTINRFTNDVITPAAYRLRLAAESTSFDIKGLLPAGAYYAVTDFYNLLQDDVSDTAAYYETDKPLVGGRPQKRITEQVRTLYWRNDIAGPLPFLQLESRALTYENYQLAYTDALAADVFGNKVNAGLLQEGKFTQLEPGDKWWIRSGTALFSNVFFMPVAYTDPFGAVTSLTYYGNYFLMTAAVENALGNVSAVEIFNFRTLSPQRIRDVNGNLSEAISDELGLVKAVAVMGKGTEADDLTGLTEITSAAESGAVQTFLMAVNSTNLISAGKTLLQQSTTRFIYDLNAFVNKSKPVVAAAITREEHFQKNNNAPVQLVFEYSNGLGETIMKKMQAAPGMAKMVSIEGSTVTVATADTAAMNPMQLRWIGNGRTIHNNKGKAVKEYEPYFSVTHQFEEHKELVETGVTPFLYYDAAGRLIKTERPDGCFSKILFDAWQQTIYDFNDTVLESRWYTERVNRLIDPQLIAQGKDPVKEQQAAIAAALHSGTAAVLHFDTPGRPVLSVEHNRDDAGADLFYYTKVSLDAEGNLLAITDARDNTVMQFKYDMLGHKIWQQSMDAGQRWLLPTIAGSPLRTWDERGHEFRYEYDILQRPTTSQVLGGDGSTPLNHIVSRAVYGEQLLLPGRSNEAALQAKNILGQIIVQYDTGGSIETPGYDFKGQPLTTTRKLFSKYEEICNWTDDNLATDLESDAFTFITRTDALGRVSQQLTPDNSVITPGYNEGGLLCRETVLHNGAAAPVEYIKNISYNEKGQREKIIYGSDVSTKYEYDKETFRLLQLQTKRKNNDPLQDWHYTYDPVGNITHIEDKNIPVVFFDNQKTSGVAAYTYDALYRLAAATGRENNAALELTAPDNWNDASFLQHLNAGDAIAARNYTQRYHYDAVGNIMQMQHLSAGNNWTRTYSYQTNNNRLVSTQVGDQVFLYPHHVRHGFITAMPHLASVDWNFKEELVRTSQQQRNDGGIAETTCYQYDGSGQRIRKITTLQAAPGAMPAKKDERIYIAGYELYKKHSGRDAGLERTTLGLVDAGHRFVMIETRNGTDDGTPQQLVRYQLHNHLDSAAMELDESAQLISYEEYHPFGTTAFQAINAAIKSAAKRFRYTGMERDEETGFGYHSARYYLPWLGRWLSSDPIGIAAGVNEYSYCLNNPIAANDKTGTEGKSTCTTSHTPAEKKVDWKFAAEDLPPFTQETIDNMMKAEQNKARERQQFLEQVEKRDIEARNGTVCQNGCHALTGIKGAGMSTQRANQSASDAITYLITGPLMIAGGFEGLAAKGILEGVVLPALGSYVLGEASYQTASALGADETESEAARFFGGALAGGLLSSKKLSLNGKGFAPAANANAELKAAISDSGLLAAGETEAMRGTRNITMDNVPMVIVNNENAYSFDTKSNGNAMRLILRDIESSNPGAAVYVGSGGHATSQGHSFIDYPQLRYPGFINSDIRGINKIIDTGIGQVLDLNDPAQLNIFKAAERMSTQPGQNHIFTIRAWCFSARTTIR